MELKDTVEMMLSDDYKERFRAEYLQLNIRFVKLQDMVNNWEHLGFHPTLSREFYLIQIGVMKAYMRILEFRARAEGSDL